MPLRSDAVHAATMQMAQEVSQADCAVFDGGASQAATTVLQVRVDLVNAQARKALLVSAGTEGAQEPQRMRGAFGPRLRVQPTQISKPRVVLVYEVLVKGFERGSRRVREPAIFRAPGAAACEGHQCIDAAISEMAAPFGAA